MRGARFGTRRIGCVVTHVIVGRIPVGAPFPDVAVHVEQAERVGRVRTNLLRLGEERAFLVAAVRVIAVEVGLAGCQRIAVVGGGCGAGAAGIFSFGFGGQAVAAAGGFLRGQGTQAGACCLRFAITCDGARAAGGS